MNGKFGVVGFVRSGIFRISSISDFRREHGKSWVYQMWPEIIAFR